MTQKWSNGGRKIVSVNSQVSRNQDRSRESQGNMDGQEKKSRAKPIGIRRNKVAFSYGDDYSHTRRELHYVAFELESLALQRTVL